MNKKTVLTWAACALAVAGTACAPPAQKQPSPMSSLTPPVMQAPSPSVNPGSLYSQAAQPNYLYEDNRARRIGDIVMVNVVEKSNAKNKSKTKSNGKNTMDMNVNNYFNQHSMTPIPGNSLLKGATGLDLAGAVGMQGYVGTGTPIVNTSRNNQFDSDGETSRESTVTYTIGCRVVNILPGGVMQVEGARQVRVNDDTQIMVVRGLLRPMDVGPDNTVSSTSLAEAQVDMFGTGVLADRQKPGWLSRILDNMWPF
ncbi:MAG: flagellar basal body L-ring protein FlgH [Desulfovibrio sp.]|nr:flagellar basal body L-ring protein FlgH [Desulfovibrio sp.]MBI4961492.1 flagellar basal body L-ring protein FlgH [Desulfovibrio sp.]